MPANAGPSVKAPNAGAKPRCGQRGTEVKPSGYLVMESAEQYEQGLTLAQRGKLFFELFPALDVVILSLTRD